MSDSPTTSQAATDEDLAARAASGSVASFEELVRRYQVVLLRFLQRRSPSPHEAEDVLQETFLRAYRSIGTYRSGRPFKPWLFTIAYRLAIDAGRRPSLKLARTDNVTSDLAAGPPDRLAAVESAGRLWATVRATLGEELFTAVWLHYADDLPPRQVAAVMGRSQVWVRTTLHRARHRLAVVLAPERPAGKVECVAVPWMAAGLLRQPCRPPPRHRVAEATPPLSGIDCSLSPQTDSGPDPMEFRRP